MLLANQLATFALSDIEGATDARTVMAMSLLDWAACGRAGREEPVAQKTRSLVLSEGGAAQATLIGGGKSPARGAALVNGATSHALDYDDTHFAHIGHPSVAVIPAALAIAEGEGASMSDLLDAALIGVEASIRIGVWLGRDHYETGFHQTATAGSFGATLAACRLLGLSVEQTAQAIGLVSTRASGLKSQFGTMGKPFNAGLAASNGVEAALLAAQGFVSNPGALDEPQGFGPTHHGIGALSAFDDIGTAWQFETVSHKFHACCHGLHAMLEALGSLDVCAGEVEEVTITTHPRWDRVCNNPSPATGLEAKFSYRHTAAMALSGYSTAAMDSYTAELANAPDLVSLRNKVRVAFDDTLAETQSRVAVTASGQTQTAFHDLLAPQPLATREAKVAAKAEALIGSDNVARIKAAIEDDDLSAFVEVISA